MTPSQCRAGRALLNWSQDDLETAARVSKKTIADFERDQRNQQVRTIEAIEMALTSHGVIFISANGGGEGVRKRASMPRLFRRDDVEHRGWVAFAVDYKEARFTGFVWYNALAGIALDNLSPLEVFDRDTARILMCAAEKIDEGQLDPDGRVFIERSDMPPVAFEPSTEFDGNSRLVLHLICRRPFATANGIRIDAVDYNGFRLTTRSGKTRTFLKLRAGDGDHDAVDVTAAVLEGAFIISERV